MVTDLREMQENQGFSENQIDKLEFIGMIAPYSRGRNARFACGHFAPSGRGHNAGCACGRKESSPSQSRAQRALTAKP